MGVKTHPVIEGAWQIDWWLPNPDRPVNPKTGKRPLKRHYETYVGSYEDAVTRWTELCQQHRTLKNILGNPRINECLPDYLAHVELNNSHGYYKSICWAWKKLKPHFGRHPVSHITTGMVEDFKRQHKATPRHCNQCLQYLKILISWMVRESKAQPLPFKIVLLKYTERLPMPPDPAEFDAILNTVRENYKRAGTGKEERAIHEALIHTIYNTGLRFKEARHLQWQHLRWSDGRCLASVTKTGIERYCIIPKEARDLLEPYKKKKGYIFTNPGTGKPFTSIRKGLKAAAEKNGITLRGAHDLRHAAGTDSYDATGDIYATQELLGHTTLKMTQKYTHISIARKQRTTDQTAAFRKAQRQNQTKPPDPA